MSSVIIAGNTSGTITLDAPNVAGTTTLTLPTTSGTITTKDTNGILSVNGVQFPSTQSASADANCLDDYEEGTYTVTVNSGGGSITSYTSYGKYTKVGNVVNMFASVRITNAGSASGVIQFTLPFTPVYPETTDQPGGVVRESGQTGNVFFGTLSTGVTKITIQNSTNGGITWGTDYRYPIQITYFTS